MAGNFQRLESAAMWLATLAGSVGITLMVAGFRWLGLLFSVVGLLIFVHRFWDELRRLRLRVISGDENKTYVPPSTELLWAITIVPAVALIAVYIFFSSSPPSQAVVNGNEVSQLRRELTELREGHPYTIPKADEEEFIDVLLSVGQHDLEIAHADNDEKAAALATRLSDLVKSVGWKVGPLNSPFFTGNFSPGLIILISREYGTSSPVAARLKAFLARPNINIDARIQNFNSGEGGLHTLKIFVGPAPKDINK